MKIKSTVLHVLAVACMGVGLLYGMGIEGGAQLGQPITDGEFVTAMVLILAALALMRLGFAAQDAETKAAKRPYGKIDRTHARNPEYPKNQERGA